MAQVGDLVRSFVQAGFTKIHLDCSRRAGQLSDDVIVERSARLAEICEKSASEAGDLSKWLARRLLHQAARGWKRPDTAWFQPAQALATLATQKASF